MPRRLLVVTTAPVPDVDLRQSVRPHVDDDAEILVVAAASEISRLNWLTNAEDDARTEAAERAEAAAQAMPTGTVGTRVGDSDPVKAIEDALRTFPADEIIIVTRSHDESAWLEEGSGDTAQSLFSLPVTHLVVAE
ncbi:MAG: hypothetical protein ABR583_00935 [Gaiellaceae bacterium]